MVEAFKIKEEDAMRVDATPLRAATTALFAKLGVPADDAALAADVLVTADLRGVDSHGVSNELKTYIERYAEGKQNANPDWRVVKERASIANIDADLGLGVIMAPKAMEIAVAKARDTGVGVVTITNSGHLGMAAYHAMLALPHDMIGVCMTAAGASVLPTFGAEPRLGTNPYAIAAPTGVEPPWVFDMATSIVPVNKLRNAYRMGSMLPPGHIADADGNPIMEPVLAPENPNVLPLGGTREQGSHKGYGLASAVEVLCSIMSGGGFATMNPRWRFRHYLAAYDPAAFGEIAEFKSNMDSFIQDLRSTPPAPGHARVLVAGDPEHEMFEERSVKGIPLHREVVDWFRATCAEFDVPCEI
jgi:LDH2 family malate/lactate/ureidoglycolate dehydrogenase